MVFDEELSPAQGQSLEEALGTRVMDRAELILDIFATRARTSEAKLQVELAQLQYLLPRLTRMWTHLSRIRGGIGLARAGRNAARNRPPDDPHARSRCCTTSCGTSRVTATPSAPGAGPMFSAALVGYTNAGKSSILRALSGEHDIFVEDRLFATLDTLTREVDLGDTLRVRVSDTVGFIRKLPHHLVASFRATLEEAGEADLLLHVVDASHPEWEDHMRTVASVLAELGLDDRPTLVVFNKLDIVESPHAFAAHARASLSRRDLHHHDAHRRPAAAQDRVAGPRRGVPAGGTSPAGSFRRQAAGPTAPGGRRDRASSWWETALRSRCASSPGAASSCVAKGCGSNR